MRSQPWAEGWARMEMTEPHGILRGKSSAPDRREMVLWTFGNYIRRWWQFLAFEKTFAFIRDPPPHTHTIFYDLHSPEHLFRWTEYCINRVTASEFRRWFPQDVCSQSPWLPLAAPFSGWQEASFHPWLESRSVWQCGVTFPTWKQEIVPVWRTFETAVGWCVVHY